MTTEQKELLIQAWNWCDQEDKSSEFMFSYMCGVAKMDYEEVVEFVMFHERTEKELEL